MAYAKFSFDAKNIGDAASATTSYVAEIVSCSNTVTPLQVNGYTFRTTLSDAAKTGDDIEIIFEGVPANTIIPANWKLKITANKNGNQIVRYQEPCNANSLLICAEAPTGCTISNVAVAQPICNGGTILQPYSFTTNQLGIHRIQLFRILADGSAPTNVKSVDINVTSLNILQTGTFPLETLNSDNYRLYVYALDDEGGNECVGTSQITLLTCGASGDCIKPIFDAVIENPVCNGVNITLGKISIANIVGGAKVRYCAGQTWNCNEDYNIGVDITANDNFVVSQNIGLSPGQAFDFYVVRVYKTPTCFLDKVVKFTRPDCQLNPCTVDNPYIYNGQSVVKEFSYKNTDTVAKYINIRLEPTTPIDVTIKKGSTVVFTSDCGGIDVTSCDTCVQAGILCASVLAGIGEVITINIDSTCSPINTSNYSLIVSCQAIPACATVIKLGESNTCGITIPTGSAKFTCNSQTNDVSLSVEGYYGAISNEYEFGYDIAGLWQNASQVSWERTNKKVVPKAKAFRIWVRDKNNTSCTTVLDVTSPNCGVSQTYPIINASSLVENFSQSGNTLTASVSNIVAEQDYDVTYTYLDEVYNRGGILNKNTNTITLPLVNKAGLIEAKLANKVSGAVSNKVYFNVLSEQSIYIDVIENACQTTIDTATYLHLKARSTSGTTKFKFLFFDAVTGEQYYNIQPPGNETYIKHTETNRKINIQVVDADNPLKGSQLYPITLVQNTCTSVPSECDCIAKVAYGVNARNTGTTPDSIKFIYKGTTCKRYKMYVESESTRGLYELYIDKSGSDEPVRTLTGAYSDYNYMPVEALASRVWRDKNYKIKYEFYNSGSVVKVVEFIVDLTSSSPLNVPIVKFECGNTATNNCALTDKLVIGTRGTNKIQSRFLNNQIVVVEQTQDSDALSKDRFIPRGSNFLTNSSVTVTRANTTSACFADNVTSFGGLTAPKFLRPVNHPTEPGDGYVPNGYRAGITSDNTVYFELLTAQEIVSYPCDQTPCTTYTGVLPPTDGSDSSVVYYPLNILERKNNNIATGVNGNLKAFASRAEAIALAAYFVANGNVYNPDGYKISPDVVVTIRNGVYQNGFVVGDYLINNNIPPFTPGPAQCGFFIDQVDEGSGDLALSVKYNIITTDPCGKILNIERINITDTAPPVSNDLNTLAGTMRTLEGVIDSTRSHQDWGPEFMTFVVTNLGGGKVSLQNTAPTRNPSDFGLTDRIARYVVDYGVGRVTLNGDADFVGKQFEAYWPIQIWLFWDKVGYAPNQHDQDYMRGYSKLVIK